MSGAIRLGAYWNSLPLFKQTVALIAIISNVKPSLLILPSIYEANKINLFYMPNIVIVLTILMKAMLAVAV